MSAPELHAVDEATQPSFPSEELEVGGRTIRLTHTDRVYFPAAGVTKGRVLRYYHDVAPYLLPHLRDRPLNLERFPEGITAESFYQKNASTFFPAWLRTFPIEYRRAHKTSHHVLIDDTAGLLYLVNLGTITFHAFLSRIDDLTHPDLLILDIDPPDLPGTSPAEIDREESFKPAVETAFLLREELRLLGLDPVVKTSGKRGLHLGLPLDRRLTYDQVRGSLTELFTRLSESHPHLVTRAMRKDQRGGRVYLDALRMALGATVVPPYVVRATPQASVSMPVTWDELADLPHAQIYTVANALDRLAQVGDLWAGLAPREPNEAPESSPA